MYRQAGGDPRLDISNVKLYPNIRESGHTPGALHAAGGFGPIVGDSKDLTRGRVHPYKLPSRVTEGFGQVILDAGQEEANPIKKRPVSIRTGVGRGHAQQDTLNIEIFAHGSRRAGPDRSHPSPARNTPPTPHPPRRTRRSANTNETRP